MKVIVNGAAGRMGAQLLSLCEQGYAGAELVAAVDKVGGYLTDLNEYQGDADVVVDFSHHACTKAVCDYAVARSLPLVIATTGQTEEERAYVCEASKKTAIFFSGNMSVGIALLRKLIESTVRAFPTANVEIVEVHHNRKLDAPSGTALLLANAVKEVRPNASLVCGREGICPRSADEIGIHSLRYGNIVGQHEVIVSTDAETITLKHEAHSRAVFAEGALTAAAYMVGKEVGLYEMNDLLGVKK